MKIIPFKLNDSGISTLFVVSSMFFTMFIGTTMLKMVTSDHLGRALYNSSESARQTAKSGMTSAISTIQNAANNPSTLAMLQSWIDSKSNSPVELVSGSLTDDDNFTYKVELFAFDHSNFNVTLKAEGTGKADSRAHMTTVYNLRGLEFEAGSSSEPNLGSTPNCALQIDNGNYEFNCELQIDGNTQVFEKMTGNNGPFTFNGDFRIDPHRVTGSIPPTVFNKGVTITGNAYFGGPITCYGTAPLVLHGKAAFEDSMTFREEKITMLGSDIYLNDCGLLEGTGITDMGAANIHYYSGGTYHEQSWSNPGIPIESFFTTTGSMIPSVTEFTGLRDSAEVYEPEPKVDFNYQYVLDNAPNIITVPAEHSVTNADLDTWYADQLANGQLYKDKFLVIHYPPTYTNSRGTIMDARASQFDGKAIIIVEAPQFDIFMLETTDNANVGLYIHSVGNFDPKLKDFGNFRGFIYLNEVTSEGYITFYLRRADPAVYRGSIYAGENARCKFDGGMKKHHIIYDTTVLNELAIAGIFASEVAPSEETTETTSGTTLKLKDTHANIIADLISQSL